MPKGSSAAIDKGREQLQQLAAQTEKAEDAYRKAIARRDATVNKLIAQGALYTDLARDLGVSEGAIRAIVRRKASSPPPARRRARG